MFSIPFSSKSLFFISLDISSLTHGFLRILFFQLQVSGHFPMFVPFPISSSAPLRQEHTTCFPFFSNLCKELHGQGRVLSILTYFCGPLNRRCALLWLDGALRACGYILAADGVAGFLPGWFSAYCSRQLSRQRFEVPSLSADPHFFVCSVPFCVTYFSTRKCRTSRPSLWTDPQSLRSTPSVSASILCFKACSIWYKLTTPARLGLMFARRIFLPPFSWDLPGRSQLGQAPYRHHPRGRAL